MKSKSRFASGVWALTFLFMLAGVGCGPGFKARQPILNLEEIRRLDALAKTEKLETERKQTAEQAALDETARAEEERRRVEQAGAGSLDGEGSEEGSQGTFVSELDGGGSQLSGTTSSESENGEAAVDEVQKGDAGQDASPTAEPAKLTQQDQDLVQTAAETFEVSILNGQVTQEVMARNLSLLNPALRELFLGLSVVREESKAADTENGEPAIYQVYANLVLKSAVNEVGDDGAETAKTETRALSSEPLDVQFGKPVSEALFNYYNLEAQSVEEVAEGLIAYFSCQNQDCTKLLVMIRGARQGATSEQLRAMASGDISTENTVLAAYLFEATDGRSEMTILNSSLGSRSQHVYFEDALGLIEKSVEQASGGEKVAGEDRAGATPAREDISEEKGYVTAASEVTTDVEPVGSASAETMNADQDSVATPAASETVVAPVTAGGTPVEKPSLYRLGIGRVINSRGRALTFGAQTPQAPSRLGVPSRDPRLYTNMGLPAEASPASAVVTTQKNPSTARTSDLSRQGAAAGQTASPDNTEGEQTGWFGSAWQGVKSFFSQAFDKYSKTSDLSVEDAGGGVHTSVASEASNGTAEKDEDLTRRLEEKQN